jgi:hypothetical protein
MLRFERMLPDAQIVPPARRITNRVVARRPWTERVSLLFAGCALATLLVVAFPSDVYGALGKILPSAAFIAGLLALVLRGLEKERLVSISEVERPTESSGPVIH